MRSIRDDPFQAQCLTILDEVARTGEPIVVTKRGRSVVRIEPVEEPALLHGSVRYLVDDQELLFSTGEIWDVSLPR